jgi:hypothetical protein
MCVLFYTVNYTVCICIQDLFHILLSYDTLMDPWNAYKHVCMYIHACVWVYAVRKRTPCVEIVPVTLHQRPDWLYNFHEIHYRSPLKKPVQQVTVSWKLATLYSEAQINTCP